MAMFLGNLILSYTFGDGRLPDLVCGVLVLGMQERSAIRLGATPRAKRGGVTRSLVLSSYCVVRVASGDLVLLESIALLGGCGSCLPCSILVWNDPKSGGWSSVGSLIASSAQAWSCWCAKIIYSFTS